ncbi:hypothetical protein [Burkholderia stagnalis]|uniref:hypothetical protein n=1 Tax=Burkholderia stagnalis TaxID=1503054 RepID=UPI00325A9B09
MMALNILAAWCGLAVFLGAVHFLLTRGTRRAEREQQIRRATAAPRAPRFPMTYCSQCGCELGPGDSGVSSCADHTGANTRKGG